MCIRDRTWGPWGAGAGWAPAGASVGAWRGELCRVLRRAARLAERGCRRRQARGGWARPGPRDRRGTLRKCTGRTRVVVHSPATVTADRWEGRGYAAESATRAVREANSNSEFVVGAVAQVGEQAGWVCRPLATAKFIMERALPSDPFSRHGLVPKELNTKAQQTPKEIVRAKRAHNSSAVCCSVCQVPSGEARRESLAALCLCSLAHASGSGTQETMAHRSGDSTPRSMPVANQAICSSLSLS